MAVLRALHGIGPGYYHTAGFWRRELCWKDKTNQLGAHAYKRRIMQLNPAPYHKLSGNKVAEKALLTLFGIPTPRFLGRLESRVGRDTDGYPLRGAEELARLVRTLGAKRLVFKRTEGPEGFGGKGVHIPFIERDESVTFREPRQAKTTDVSAYCADTLELDRGGDWLVEEYFEQHPVLAKITPESVNTVRVWVANTGGDGYQVLTAYLRIGRANMIVDNASSGGIVAAIEMESGRLSAARDAHPAYHFYPTHPDYDTPIEGGEIPWWQEVQELSKQALSVFPILRFAGVDVAIGPSGPVVLELNLEADYEGAAFTNYPNKPGLNVRSKLDKTGVHE
jgi:hypothetical protein